MIFSCVGVALCIPLLYAIALSCFNALKFRMRSKGLPSPKGSSWLFGHLFSYMREAHVFLTQSHRELGPAISVWRGWTPVVSITDRTLVQKVLCDNGTYTGKAPWAWSLGFVYLMEKVIPKLAFGVRGLIGFVDALVNNKKPMNPASLRDPDYLKFKGVDVVDVANLVQVQGGKSFNVLGDAAWRAARRAVNPLFKDFMEINYAAATRAIEDVVSDLVRRARMQSGKLDVDLQEEAHNVTLNTGFRVLLGYGWEELGEMIPTPETLPHVYSKFGEQVPLGIALRAQFVATLEFCAKEFEHRPAWKHVLPMSVDPEVAVRLEWSCALINKVLKRKKADAKEILDRGEAYEPKDMMGLLLKAQATNPQYLPDDIITYTITNLLIAAAESPASGIGNALYFIAHHGDVQNSLAAEVEGVYDRACREEQKADEADNVVDPMAPLPGDRSTGRKVAALPMGALKELAGVSAALKEALRLRPPATIVHRVIKKDLTAGNTTIPAGTTVAVPIFAIHHDPAIWEDPCHFDHSRFMGSKPIDQMSFLPFSQGNRRCPGGILALAEGEAFIAALLHHFSFTPEDAQCADGGSNGADGAPLERFALWTPTGLNACLKLRHSSK